MSADTQKPKQFVLRKTGIEARWSKEQREHKDQYRELKCREQPALINTLKRFKNPNMSIIIPNHLQWSLIHYFELWTIYSAATLKSLHSSYSIPKIRYTKTHMLFENWQYLQTCTLGTQTFAQNFTQLHLIRNTNRNLCQSKEASRKKMKVKKTIECKGMMCTLILFKGDTSWPTWKKKKGGAKTR